MHGHLHVGFWHADNDSQIQESMSRRVDSAQAAAKRHKGQCQDESEKTNEKMDLLRRTQPDYNAPLVVPGFTGAFRFSSASSASGELQQRIARTEPEQFPLGPQALSNVLTHVLSCHQLALYMHIVCQTLRECRRCRHEKI